MIRDLQDASKFLDEDIQDADVELIDGVKIEREDETLKKQNKINELSIKKELQGVSDLAHRISNTQGLTGLQTKAVNLADIIYGANDTSKSDYIYQENPNKKQNKRNIASTIYTDGWNEKIQDCSKYFTPAEEMLSREEYAAKARYRFITGVEFTGEDEESEDEKPTDEFVNKMKSELITNDLGMIKKGQYVKINIKGVKFKNYKGFTEKPVIVNFHDYKEENLGFNLVRFKRHRWYRSLLKSFDPLIISSGFRRFQTIPVFITKDQNERMRYLKYTPQWDYTFMIIYGPYIQQNTGIVAMQS